MVVLADNAPLVPVTVSVYGPGATPAPTLMVTIEEAFAGFVPNVAVMPAGQLDAASVTVELKPFAGTIVTVEVPLDPAVTVAAVALSAKLGAGFTVNAIVVLADKVLLVPFTVSVYGPGATFVPTKMVTVEEAVAGFGPKFAVIPVGQFDAASVTAELKPFAGTIVTV